MAELNTIIKLRQGTTEQWAESTVVLGIGEMGLEYLQDGSGAVKIKAGDGESFWSALPYIGSDVKDANVFQVTMTANDVDDIAAIEAKVAEEGATKQNGDVAIVRSIIATNDSGEEKISYTSYVYDSEYDIVNEDGTYPENSIYGWTAMEGNYNANNVIFKNDITLAGAYTAVGNVTKSSNAAVGTLKTTGKTLTEVMQSIFTQEVEPTVTQPTATMTASAPNSGASLEIGSYITKLNWDGNATYGSYKVSGGADQGTGIGASNFTWAVSNDKTDATSTAMDSSFTLEGDDRIQINSTSEKTYAKVTAKVTLDVSSVKNPKTNLGNERPAKKIIGFDTKGTTEKTIDSNIKLTGYRNTWYYVGTDCTTSINSDFIRSSTAKNANTKNIGTLNIPAGTKRVMVAIPGSATLSSVIDVIGQQLDVKDNFTKETISVQGANGYTAADYTVFHFENSNGIAETKYTFTIN